MPEQPSFLALASGYYFGKFQYKGLGLGAVTATLLCGVLIGAVLQTGGHTIHIDVRHQAGVLPAVPVRPRLQVGPPVLRRCSKGDGLPQAIFTVVLIVVGLGTVIVLAKVLKYDPGLAAGLAAGALTQSAIIGVAQTSIAGLGEKRRNDCAMARSGVRGVRRHLHLRHHRRGDLLRQHRSPTAGHQEFARSGPGDLERRLGFRRRNGQRRTGLRPDRAPVLRKSFAAGQTGTARA